MTTFTYSGLISIRLTPVSIYSLTTIPGSVVKGSVGGKGGVSLSVGSGPPPLVMPGSIGGRGRSDFQVEIGLPVSPIIIPCLIGSFAGASLGIKFGDGLLPNDLVGGGRGGVSLAIQVARHLPDTQYNFPAMGYGGVSLGVVVGNPPLAVIVPLAGGGLSGVELFPGQAEEYETWVLNDNGFAPAAYTGWPFNSFALYRGQYYAAGENGLYLLGGPDQDGAEFHPGVRIAPVNFSTARPKRLRLMRLEASGHRVTVRLATERGDEGIFPVDGNQVPVSRDIQGREWVVDIQDFQEFSFMEIIPLILVTR